MRTLALLVLLALGSPAVAQSEATTLPDRLASVQPATATAAECDRQVSQATILNGPDLLLGASACFSANRPIEGSFLLNAGQVRSSVDLVLTVPATRADSELQTSLYGFIYARAGGPGSEDIFRDEASRSRFFQLFDDWSPQYSDAYNPGWNVRRRPDAAAYRAATQEMKAGRRQQLLDVVRLYSDDIYFAVWRRFGELQARNPGGFVEGTQDAALSRDLQRQMDDRAVALGAEPTPGIPDPDDPSSARFPPHLPAADEEILSSSTDPVVQRCADMVERMTIAEDTRIVRILITRSPEWGVIWRADLAGGVLSPQRVMCSADTTSIRPLDLGDETIPPLPEAGRSAAGHR